MKKLTFWYTTYDNLTDRSYITYDDFDSDDPDYEVTSWSNNGYMRFIDGDVIPWHSVIKLRISDNVNTGQTIKL